MKIISWNINGIRACSQKGLLEFIDETNADIYCFQEIKACPDKIPDSILNHKNYNIIINSAEKKGYSGTLIMTKEKFIEKKVNFEFEENYNEGRVIQLEFEKFYLINVYTPNAKSDLSRLDYRVKWDKEFKNYIHNLDQIKPVIVCGDLNVAHKEIDLANPKTNTKSAGFTIEERTGIENILADKMLDCFRYFNQEPDHYTWWSYRANSRNRNVGWRIDYFLASKQLQEKLQSCIIHRYTLGSDHCPIELNLV